MNTTHSARAQLRALLEAAVDAIILIDGDGHIKGFNQAAEAMFGYAAHEVTGRNVDLLMPEPYRSEHRGYIQRYQRTGEARIIGIGREVEARHRDGSVFPINLSVGEITQEGGPARFVGIIRDISRQKRAEEEAAAHRDALAHIARLGTMAEMGTGIAHEINQPLAAISAYARATQRLLQEATPNVDAACKALNHITEQAQRGSAILQRVRDMVRHRRSEREILPLGDLLQQLRPLAEIDARQRGLTLVWQIPPDLPAVDADPVQIQQVLVNLLHNASEAMSGARTADQIVITARRLGADQVMVSVRDHGPGLPDGDVETLMEPFVSHKPDGLGVGLGICSSILAAHGGTLSLHNASDAGAIATCTLPVAGYD